MVSYAKTAVPWHLCTPKNTWSSAQRLKLPVHRMVKVHDGDGPLGLSMAFIVMAFLCAFCGNY